MYVSPEQAKLVSMLAIGVGSFVVGVAPACFVSRFQDLQQKLLLSCTLCFGGGVLLATAILHMLPEVRDTMPEYAELIFSCGFLLLYLIDELVHYLWGNDIDHETEAYQQPGSDRNFYDRSGRCRSHSHQVGYNATTQNVRSVCMQDGNLKIPYPASHSGNGIANSWKNTSYGAVQFTPGSAPTPCCNDEATFLCHGNHAEPCSGTNAGLFGLLVALTVHAVLEGLAIGLQKKTAEVLLLVVAVASHKFVVGFCLGLELAEAESRLWKFILAIFVFSSGSALGIGIGMLTLTESSEWAEVALPILQGLAGGTLLYVTVSEVFPRERARWHRSSRRCAGLLQFLSVGMGYVIIFLINNYVGR